MTDHISEACNGIFIDPVSGEVKIKDTHTNNISTQRIAGILDKLLDEHKIIVSKTDPITLQWIGEKI